MASLLTPRPMCQARINANFTDRKGLSFDVLCLNTVRKQGTKPYKREQRGRVISLCFLAFHRMGLHGMAGFFALIERDMQKLFSEIS